MNISHTLYKCTVNREMTVDYNYNYEAEDTRFKPTIHQHTNGTIYMQSYFGVRVSEGYQKNNIYITAKQYFTFVSLLKKAVSLISSNLYKLYPNIGGSSFDIDHARLERFQNEEKSLYANKMSMYPSIWVDKTGQPFASIDVGTIGGSVNIPFEDALGMVEMFQTFDPYSFGVNLLRLLGKIE